ncbi:hypothetical protein ACIRRH_40170 [Kitasatospora sp. NPDC101235]|uniref:hypothetical protein n=1 Tax=Kitasatospora sp. NPDC101235 TaxID=3364101 RepID=UPI00380A6B4E
MSALETQAKASLPVAAAGLHDLGRQPGWTRAPGLFYVRRNGRALAWTEHGVNRLDGWGVVIEGHFLSYTADPQRPLATTTVEQAARLVRDALGGGPGRRRHRTDPHLTGRTPASQDRVSAGPARVR